jgi:hypothetical protein
MLNLKPVFVDQFETIRIDGTDATSKSDVATLYGLPLILAGIAAGLGWRMGGVGNLLAALSLMTGLLFNLLVLAFDVALRAAAQVRRSQVESMSTSPKIKLIRQLQANTTYALVVAILATVTLAVGSSLDVKDFNRWTTALMSYLLLHFLLMLMVIIKRIRSIFRNELRD